MHKQQKSCAEFIHLVASSGELLSKARILERDVKEFFEFPETIKIHF